MVDVLKFAQAYRQLKRPPLKTGNTFEFSSTAFDSKLDAAIDALLASRTGRFDEFIVDGMEIHLTSENRPKSWSCVEFTFVLDTSGIVPIFKNFDELMARSKSFVRSPMPELFYLLDDDVFSTDQPVDPRVTTLQAICRLIVYLADLAHFHDEKESSEEYKLVFIAEDIAQGERAITLYPYLDHELLDYKVGTDLVDSLQMINLDASPHLLKERSIFRASLIEYLSDYAGGKERFLALIANWEHFLTLYGNNLSTYLSGFSFHKAKQEVATAQLAVAEQMSKVVSDISGKVLSVPISMAAIIVILKSDGVLESSILVAGITITSALLAETLAAQQLQYERIKHSREIIFSSHKNKLLQYPQDLRNYINSAAESLSKNEKKLKHSLLSLRYLSWLPAISATLLFMYIYYEDFKVTVEVLNTLVGRLQECILA